MHTPTKASFLPLVLLAAAAPFAAAQPVSLSNFSNFTPLADSVPTVALPANAPFQFGNAGWTQRSIADRAAQLGLGQFNSGAWDMIDVNRTGPDAGRYVFSVFETLQAGVQRTDRLTGATVTLWAASALAPAPGSAVAFDPALWTPWGTLLTAEEAWGPQPMPYGRLFELTNPLTATGTTGADAGNLVQRNAVARVRHEGLAFDNANNLYYVDEFDRGSIYRYSSATPASGATYFNGGTNAVLRVGDGAAPGAAGQATWVNFTNAGGTALPGAVTVTDPALLQAVDGRATTAAAAASAPANPYQGSAFNRPEDIQIQTLKNGEQVLYVAATGSHEVFSINLKTNKVQSFASQATMDVATGKAVGDGFLSPDNLAVDADGNIYIVEDRADGKSAIWFATDADRDGVAESLSRWATLSTVGGEPTGLFFDPTNPNRAYVNVMFQGGNDRLIEINAAVPEPSSVVLMVAGLAVLFAPRLMLRRRTPRSVRSCAACMAASVVSAMSKVSHQLCMAFRACCAVRLALLVSTRCNSPRTCTGMTTSPGASRAISSLARWQRSASPHPSA